MATAGSRYTVNYSKHSNKNIEKDKVLLASHFADFKSIFSFGQDLSSDQTYMILNAGMGENPFAPNYFNMNRDFYEGQVYKTELNLNVLANSDNYILKLIPLV